MDNIDIIDVVIPWVDPSDPEWQKVKRQYSPQVTVEDDDREIRYRDWDNLKYWFRGIEEFAPWINKIHFITYGHLPKWLNVNAPKLHIVKHEDYIPKEYLPLFSSHVIELNMHRIEGLSDKFIYFNDDMFLIKKTKPEDFFKNNLPCDVNIPNLIMPNLATFSPIVFNTVEYINKNFSKRALIRKSPGKYYNLKYGFVGFCMSIMFSYWGGYTGFYNHHLPSAYLKSTLEEVWQTEPEILEKTCSHRFRDNNDVNQYIFRYWQLASGNFVPSTLKGKYFLVSSNNNKILNYIKKGKGKMICVNDAEFSGNFELAKSQINEAFDKILPNKSSFEI